MLEDLVGDALAEVRGTKKTEITIEVILAIIGLGISVLTYCHELHKKSYPEMLRDAKYPTLATRLRFRHAMTALKFQGDREEAMSVTFRAMMKADLDDVAKELQEKNNWVF
jgi:hypothetical protein